MVLMCLSPAFDRQQAWPLHRASLHARTAVKNRACLQRAIPQGMQQHGGISKTAQRRREQASEERSPATARNADQSDAQTEHDVICTRATA
jgi:hypothetical protein